MRCNELRRTWQANSRKHVKAIRRECRSAAPNLKRSQLFIARTMKRCPSRWASAIQFVPRLADCRRAFPLGLYHYWCAEADGVIKLARFPIRHSNASVRRRHPWQVALVQSVARRELEKVGHRGAHEVRMGRFGVTPGVDIGLHDSARVIDVVTIETGSMILVLANHLKATNRSAVSFATTGYARRRGSIPSAIKIRFLRPQTYDD